MGVAERRVLNISEVRDRLSEVRDEALHGGAIVHWGDRGRDELVTLSTELFRRLLAYRAESAAKPEGDAWAAFDAALAAGRLADSGDVGPRRRMPGLPDLSSVAWKDVPALVGKTHSCRRTRSISSSARPLGSSGDS